VRILEVLVYLLKRILMAVLVLLLVSVIIFLTVRMTPGDPVLNKIGPYGDTSPENYARVSAEMGMDQPVMVQYLKWLRNCARLDFGVSLRSGVPIVQTIGEKLPVSLELITVALIIAIILAIPLGMAAALRPNSLADQAIGTLSTSFLAVPVFSIALLMIILFSVKLKIFPASGYVPFRENPIQNLRHLALPGITLGFYEMAIFCRHVRSQALDVLGANYVRTAKAKGLTNLTIHYKHVLKNIMVMMVTIIGTEFATLFGSTVICEQIFGWSGLGWYIYQSIANRDYPAVQASILVVAVIFVVVNLLMDIVIAAIDPRVKLK